MHCDVIARVAEALLRLCDVCFISTHKERKRKQHAKQAISGASRKVSEKLMLQGYFVPFVVADFKEICWYIKGTHALHILRERILGEPIFLMKGCATSIIIHFNSVLVF